MRKLYGDSLPTQKEIEANKLANAKRREEEATPPTPSDEGSDASTCSMVFSAGLIVSHRLNELHGIITSKGTLRNGGQCWNVRFERENYFEELEVWEHELFLPND